MKNFLLFILAVLAVNQSAMSTDYLYGDLAGNIAGNTAGFGNTWSDALKGIPFSGGKITNVRITAESWFRIWSGSESKAYGPYENDYKIPNSGTEQTYGMQVQDGNAFELAPGVYDFTYDSSNHNITVKKTAAAVVRYYLYGEINGKKDWANHTTPYRLIKQTDGTYSRNFTITQKSYFRVSDGANGYGPAADTEVTSPVWTSSEAALGSQKAYVIAPGTYSFKFNPTTNTLTVATVSGGSEDSDYVWIYFNAAGWGAYALSDDNPYIYCHVYNKDNGQTYNGDKWNQAEQRMTRIVEQVYGYKVPKSRIGEFNDVIFYFHDKFSGGAIVEQEASKGGGWDAANWTKYIYGAGAGCAEQSYVTYEQYTAARNAEKLSIYINGQHYMGQDGTSVDNNWDPKDARKFTSEAGVFYLSYTGQNDTKFKITWMDVMDHFHQNGYTDSDYNTLRGWASFNLGIIGPEPTGAVTSLNQDFGFNRNETHTFNNFCQFNYKPEATTDKCCIVIDMHSSCQSFSLLDFDPNPVATVKAGSVERVSLGDFATAYDGCMLKDGGRSGYVFFPEVNKAGGTVNISVHENNAELAAKGYSITYSLYMDNRLVARPTSANVDCSVDYMPYGSAVSVKARAEYVDISTGGMFHSRMTGGKISQSATLNKPTLTEEKGQLFVLDNYYDAGIVCSFNVEPIYHKDADGNPTGEPLAVYADYEVLQNGTEPVDALIPSADFSANQFYINNKTPWAFDGYYLGGNYAPSTSADGYEQDINNWSWMLANTDVSMPLYVPQVTGYVDPEKLDPQNFKVKGYAVYPFLVKKTVVGYASTVAAPRRAEAVAADFNPADYELMLIYRNDPANDVDTTLDNSQVTGIDTVAADADANAPVEYFNLQGMRLAAPAAGTIVIRRQGATVTKIMMK